LHAGAQHGPPEIHGPPGGSRRERHLEWATTLLLALAALATAWSSYQAARWHGEQAKEFSQANAARVESTRASGLENRQVLIDVTTFSQWVDAYAREETVLADFYRARFRDEFKPAVDAWLATRPLQNPDAPKSPFAMPEYRLASGEEAARLQAEAAAHSEEANEDIERADQYVLCVVLFAASLFFAGMSTRLRAEKARIAVLGIGCVLFVGTLAWIGTLPVGAAL
jgi:hypothetical protein